MSNQPLVYRFKQPITLYCFTDVHIGHKKHDAAKFQKALDALKKDPNAYCFFNGDTIDITPDGYHDATNDQEFTVNEQVEQLLELFKKFKKKILFIRPGNHEERVERAIGVDILGAAKTLLKIPLLGVGAAPVTIYIGKKRYVLVSTHGVGLGNSLNSLKRIKAIFQGADVYFTGHTHEFRDYSDDMYFDTQTDETTLKAQIALAGGSFELYGRHAADKNMIPKQTGCWLLRFDEHEVQVKGSIR